MRFVRSLLLVLVLVLAAAAVTEVAAQPGGLPQRAAPPRTLRDHWHVFVAFALAWVLLFGYVVSLGRRFARVERDLRRLGGISGE
ncbi:MAG: CcmD family protein [Gemmatimonadota bacterium]|nr:CcmD family protein [Gemmatimonadota bacterium]